METNKVTRFEIIDHRPCEECEGTGWVMVPDPSPDHMEEAKQQQCINCQGLGQAGRTVIARSKDLQFDVQLQDRGKTLKVFIHERYED